MKVFSQFLFADRLPPLIGGVEIHGGAFIKYFQTHPVYPLTEIIRGPSDWRQSPSNPAILFFNSGKWIEQMGEIRTHFPLSKIVYRTGGNEIIKAPLEKSFVASHEKRQALWAKTLNESVDLLITNSQFTEDRLRKIGVNIPFASCVGGVENPICVKQERENQKPCHFFSAARFVPYKNPLLLIQVFNELYAKGAKFHLEMAGDGPLLEVAKQQARENPYIVFLGALKNEEVVEKISRADVFIQLSSDFKTEVPGGSYIHTEGMGRSLLEAISCGTYVVAGKCGALGEIVTGDRGILIPIDSVETIVSTLHKLMDSSLKQNQPTEQYSWKNLFTQYERLYESLAHY